MDSFSHSGRRLSLSSLTDASPLPVNVSYTHDHPVFRGTDTVCDLSLQEDQHSTHPATTTTITTTNSTLETTAEDGLEGDRQEERKPGRRKITIEYIEDKSKRHITFSKRKSGIMKKVFFDKSLD